MTVAGMAVAWAFHKLGLTIDSYYAIGIAGTAWTVLTWLGHEGLRGAWNRILNGSRNSDRRP